MENGFFDIKTTYLSEDEIESLQSELENLDFLSTKPHHTRAQIWMQEEEKYFNPSWTKRWNHWKAQPIVEEGPIHSLFIRLNNDLESSFNSILINKYNPEDYIDYHSDSKESFGEYPVIACISIGEPRPIVFKHKITGDTITVPFNTGSLLLMKNESQRDYFHKIDPGENTRYSLTFRRYIL